MKQALDFVAEYIVAGRASVAPDLAVRVLEHLALQSRDPSAASTSTGVSAIISKSSYSTSK